MKASQEFQSGKHQIGYVSDLFLENFGEIELTAGTALSYRTLQKRETDPQILARPDMAECTIGDILATLDSATDEMRDGNWNLFYPRDSAFVVYVSWDAGCREWCVDAWERGDDAWFAGSRVFSSAMNSETLICGPSDTLSLESLALQVKELRARVEALEK